MRLVLEGGGVRAAYSAGVCKGLLDEKVHIDAVIGSSAGSLNAAFVAAHHADELCELWAELTPHRDLISWRRQLTPFAGPGLGIDTLLDEILVGERRLDVRAAVAGDPVLYVTATDVVTGRGAVARPSEHTLIEWLRASLAIPAAYNRLVAIDDAHYVDGGVAIPVPFDVPELAQHPGPTVVVLTRKSSTMKRAPLWFEWLLVQAMVPRRAIAATLRQHELHNQVMRRLEAAEAHGEIIVSNPPDEMRLTRLTRDETLIREGIRIGVEQGRKLATRIRSWTPSEPKAQLSCSS